MLEISSVSCNLHTLKQSHLSFHFLFILLYSLKLGTRVLELGTQSLVQLLLFLVKKLFRLLYLVNKFFFLLSLKFFVSLVLLLFILSLFPYQLIESLISCFFFGLEIIFFSFGFLSSPEFSSLYRSLSYPLSFSFLSCFILYYQFCFKLSLLF